MKISVSLKSMLRQPIKTGLFITLIALISFAFSARVFEGLIVNREITYLSEQFHAVGTLIPMDDWEWEATEVRNILDESPLVDYTETLNVIPGVMDGVYSPDTDGRTPFSNQMFVYGTLINKGHFDHLGQDPSDSLIFRQTMAGDLPYLSVLSYIDLYYFDILVDTVEAALPESVAVGDTIRLFLIDYRGEKAHVYSQAQEGERYFISGQYGYNMRIIRDVFPFAPPRVIDRRRTFLTIMRYPDHYLLNDLHLQLRPLTESGIYLYPVPEGVMEEDPDIQEQVDILRENIHTVFLRTTRDMSARSDGVVLLDGRMLNQSDYENENRVAVIRAEFAALRDLSVGDTLTITMRESPFATEYIIPDAMRWFPVPQAGIRYNWETFADQYNVHSESLGFTPVAIFLSHFDIHYPLNRPVPWEVLIPAENSLGPDFDGIVYDDILYADLRWVDEIINLEMATGYITNSENDRSWRDAQTQTETFEIVGIYRATRLGNFFTVSRNNVFVPSSIIPDTWIQDVVYRNLSFVLNSPDYEDEFMVTYQPIFEELGFLTLFEDSGWDTFIAAVTPILNGILIGILSFTVLILVVFYLLIFLYFSGRRQEFAISRSLGREKVHALSDTSFPMLLISILGLLAGVIPAWHFSIRQAERTLNNIDEEIIFSQPPLVWFLLVLLALIGIILLFSTIEASKLARCSELELLQGRASSTKAKKKIKNKKNILLHHEEDRESSVVSHLEHSELSLSLLEVEVTKRNPAIIHILRTVARYIVRKPVKSVLSIAVALGFMLILSWMSALIEENIQQVNWLYENTIITATIVDDPLSVSPHDRSISFNRLLTFTEMGPLDEEGEATGDLFVDSYHAEAQLDVAITLLEPDNLDAEIDEEFPQWAFILGFSRQDMYESYHNANIIIEYADDFDLDIFEQPNLGEPVILISESLKEEMDANMGDYLRMIPALAWWDEEQNFEFYRIVGTFDSQDETLGLITPLVYLQNHIQHSLRYDRVEFELNPMLNRELDVFQEEVNALLRRSETDHIFILRDHILRVAIDPLEQNILMMQTLYPIILALSTLIATGLTTLLLLPSMKDVAIMRATGMSKLSTIIVLNAEQKILCTLGLLLGAIVSILAFGSFNLIGLGLYLAGCILASLVFSIIFANRKPLELLQVKE